MSPVPHPHHPQHVRRNFVCHCLEGGLYMGGIAFLQPETVMPKMVDSLHGSPVIVSIMPAVLAAAFAFAGLFVAPQVERLERFKPWVLTFGLLQRLPYLAAGLVLWQADHLEGWLLPVVVLTPVMSGLVGGVGVVAWMEMVTRMVPQRVRAAGWAARYIMQACIGMGAGAVIHQVLTHLPGARGYAVLHLIAFGFLFLSWLSQIPMRETPHVIASTGPAVSYWAYLRGLPALLAGHPVLLRLIAARFTGAGYLMLVSFLTLHALRTTGRLEADVGHLVSLQNVGTILGSLLAAWLGYHSGGRVLLIAARVLCVAVCAWACLTSSFAGFMAVYFVFGFGLFLDRVGDLTLTAELCPPERRTTYQAVLGFCNVGALLLATSISGFVYRQTQSFIMVAALAGGFALVSILILLRIPEPRRARNVREPTLASATGS
ncbi:MAG: MFS transporter [Verrucomicrobiaceae bacterium]|nr:MFS transporter [Verrucomicrobiaceae bacterium]